MLTERVLEKALRDLGLSKSEAITVVSEVKRYVGTHGKSNPGREHLGLSNSLSYFLTPGMKRNR